MAQHADLAVAEKIIKRHVLIGDLMLKLRALTGGISTGDEGDMP